VIAGGRPALRHPLPDRRVRAGDQDVLAARGDPVHDAGDLLGRLAGAEDHLGEAATKGAMMVDLRVPQVLVGQLPQALRGHLGIHRPALDGGEKVVYVLAIHQLTVRSRDAKGLLH
jgi:hypothetical protein